MIAQMSVRIPLALKNKWRALYFYCSLFRQSAISRVYPIHYTVYDMYDIFFTSFLFKYNTYITTILHDIYKFYNY